MKNTRIICLCLALIALLALVGCNSEIPEETTEALGVSTEAPAIEGTDPIETEPVETMKVVVFSVRAVKGNLLNKYRLELAETDKSIQGYENGIFYERNTQKYVSAKKS